ncbi:unnamed protein product, partial [Ectocarpus sp. 6 AP-2014]
DQALREHGTAADDHAVTGANEELNTRRAAAAIAWWEYEKAEKRLEKFMREEKLLRRSQGQGQTLFSTPPRCC